ncbi:hypothetical protein ACLI4Z_10820 [Natrialbaceae archaeon A-arb3/5]
MTDPSRRYFLAGSAVSLAALAGCIPTAAESDADSDAELPTEFEHALEVVPAQSTLDTGYEGIILASADVDSADDLDPEAQMIVEEFDDAVDLEDVSTVATVISEEYRARIGVVTGSFDQFEPGDERDEVGEWRLAGDDEEAFATADGVAVIAGSYGDIDATDLLEAVTETAREDEASILDEPEYAADAFARLASQRYVYFIPDPSDQILSTTNSEKLRAFVGGSELPPTQIEGTIENEFLLYPSDGEELSDEVVEEFIEDLEHGNILELEITREDDLVSVEALVEQPLERDFQSSPDARIRTEIDEEAGVVELEHEDGEPVDADYLELWLDGELVDDQPADNLDVYDVGDVITVETNPLATLTLRWVDEDEYSYYEFARVVVGNDAFEAEYDYDEEEVEITYTGERDADPDRLELIDRGQHYTNESADSQFSDSYSTLTAGDSITVEDVELETSLVLELDVPTEPSGVRPTLLRFHASPPRVHLHRADDAITARYRGDEERDAEEFQLLADGEPADETFADLSDTLALGDEFEFELPPIGTELSVEWNAPDEPVEVGRYLHTPRAQTTFEYDEDDGTLAVEHEDGDAIPAEQVELRLNGEPASVQPADEFETFGPGDSITLDVDPFAAVEQMWVGADDHEQHLGSTVTGRESIDATYEFDEGEVEFVYVGEQDADPDRIGLHRWDDAVRSNDPEPLFDDGSGSLTTGDSTVVEDVDPEERLSVVLDEDYEGTTYHRPLFEFQPEPQYAFFFESREDEVVAIYRDQLERDASAFRFRADGDAIDVQPSDEHETLEADDEIELGSFAGGTELVAEWTQPDEPTEVGDHVIVPSASFEATYDSEDESVTVEHAGGNDIDSDHLDVALPSAGGLTEWDGDGTVSEGDTATYSVDEEPQIVHVLYREREVLADVSLDG